MSDAELHDIAADLLKIVPLMMRLVAADMRQTAHSVHPAHFQLLAMLSKRPRRLSDLAEKQAVSGVSLDEEAVKLITLQRIYQASARFIQSVSEMLDVLMNI